MNKRTFLTALFILNLFTFLQAQSTVTAVENINVSSSTAQFLGKSRAIRDLPQKQSTTPQKKAAKKRFKKVPDNFQNRLPGGKSVNADLEHQGPDPLRQTTVSGLKSAATELLVNVDGITEGSAPNDPTGDVSDQHYVQAVNATEVGVFDLQGNLIQQFAMNTLWSEFGGSSLGDPIILYDENAQKWFITEFSEPTLLLIAVSETNDPLGSYNAYQFTTPEFPDYPKYAITPDALVVTTNESGPGVLHQYFFDIQALYAGETDVNMIRVEVAGNDNTEAAFYLTTPVDWNGTTPPFDTRPMVITINDSSWAGGPAQDQIEIYTFNLDFDNPNSTSVEQTAVLTTPFDSYPCSQIGMEFGCVPQLDGDPLDAIPEVIMNIPHLRNFGTHESMVFNFVTDVTNGNNLSGIRWVELRRTASTGWVLHQEGTFSPDDNLHRIVGSIAMDGNGNIGLAYAVTGENSYVGLRYTGRYANDPLGQMTIPETTIVDGLSAMDSGERLGDYSQMSVTPQGDNTFWFTAEYAGDDQTGKTRIAAFQLEAAAFDGAATAITSPVSSPDLGANELVTAQFVNNGSNPLSNYEIGFLLDNTPVQNLTISETLAPGATWTQEFTTPIDLSVIGDYEIKAYIQSTEDTNPLNDTVAVVVSKIAAIDGALSSVVPSVACESSTTANLTLTNSGGSTITSAIINVNVNGSDVDEVDYSGSIVPGQSETINYSIEDNLQVGANTVVFTISSVNGVNDEQTGNNSSTITFTQTSPDEFVTLVFNTDEFPQETAWSITNATTGAEIATGMFTEDQAMQMISQTICLPLGECYELSVTDTEGDGICCEYGDGNFSVLSAEGSVLLSNNGEFGSDVSEEFCPTAGCAIEADISVEDASSSSTDDGSILIMATGGVAPYQYSIDGGMTFQESEIFDGLLPGDYDVVINSADGECNYEETVRINFTSSTFIVNGQNVEVKILPNPTQAVFQLVVTNLEINKSFLDVELFEVGGKLIQTAKIGKFNNQYTGTFSLYDYPTGTYFLRIAEREFSFMEKIIKKQ